MPKSPKPSSRLLRMLVFVLGFILAAGAMSCAFPRVIWLNTSHGCWQLGLDHGKLVLGRIYFTSEQSLQYDRTIVVAPVTLSADVDMPRQPICDRWGCKVDRYALAYEYSNRNPAPNAWQSAMSVNLPNGNATIYPRSALTVAQIPLWPLAALLVLTLIHPICRRIQTSRWHKKGRCQNCGYDLRHSPDRCPECGQQSHNQIAPGSTAQ